MTYRVEFTASAAKEVRQLDRVVRRRVLVLLQALSDEPRPHGARRLRGRDGWRVRIGDYRVLYDIDDEGATVLVVKVGHRRDVYER